MTYLFSYSGTLAPLPEEPGTRRNRLSPVDLDVFFFLSLADFAEIWRSGSFFSISGGGGGGAALLGFDVHMYYPLFSIPPQSLQELLGFVCIG